MIGAPDVDETFVCPILFIIVPSGYVTPRIRVHTTPSHFFRLQFVDFPGDRSRSYANTNDSLVPVFYLVRVVHCLDVVVHLRQSLPRPMFTVSGAAFWKHRVREIEREVKKEEDGELIMTKVRARCSFDQSRSCPCSSFKTLTLRSLICLLAYGNLSCLCLLVHCSMFQHHFSSSLFILMFTAR
jgi:hypothetical protein